MAVKYTEEQLNNVDKSFLVALLLNQQEQMESLTRELRETNEKMQKLMEQLVLSKQERFGRSSEKMEDSFQLRFMEVDGNTVLFNEAEAVCDLTVEEPQDLEIPSPKPPRRKGKKEADLSGIPVKRIDHYLSEEKLADDRYHKRCKDIGNHLQYCGNCQSQQLKTLRLCPASAGRNTKTHE